MTLSTIQQIPAGQLPQPFFANNPTISFQFTNLNYWQLQELRKFSAGTPLVLFSDYGFNGETQKGRGCLKVSKLKVWTSQELSDFEEILGITWSQFCAYL